MFVTDGDAEGFVERAFLVGVGRVDAVCYVSRTVSDFSDLLGVEWGLLVLLCCVDPLGDDGWVRSGFEGCLVAGESSLAVPDRLARLGPLGCVVSAELAAALAWVRAVRVAVSRSGAKARAIHWSRARHTTSSRRLTVRGWVRPG